MQYEVQVLSGVHSTNSNCPTSAGFNQRHSAIFAAVRHLSPTRAVLASGKFANGYFVVSSFRKCSNNCRRERGVKPFRVRAVVLAAAQMRPFCSKFKIQNTNSERASDGRIAAVSGNTPNQALHRIRGHCPHINPRHCSQEGREFGLPQGIRQHNWNDRAFT